MAKQSYDAQLYLLPDFRSFYLGAGVVASSSDQEISSMEGSFRTGAHLMQLATFARTPSGISVVAAWWACQAQS